MLNKISFIISILVSLIIINFLNYYYVGLSYYDFGLYCNKLYNLSFYPKILTFGHFQPIIYLIKFFYTFFDIYGLFIFNLSIYLISLFLLYKFFKSKIILIFFLLYPVIYINSFINFTPELIFIPIVLTFYFFFLREDYLKSFLIIILIFLIKETYAYQLFFFGILFLIKKKYLYFFLISLISLLSIYFLNNIINTGISSNIQFHSLITDNTNIFSFSNYPFIKLIFILFCFWPIFFLGYKNFYILTPVIPYLIFIIFTDNKSYYSIFSHYSIPIIPILIYFFALNIDLKKFKFLIISFLVINLVCLSYYFSNNLKTDYSFSDYFTINSYVKKNIKKDDIITINNKVSYPSLYKRKFLFSFPYNLDSQNYYQNYFIYNNYYSDVVIIDFSQKLFIHDKVVTNEEFKNSFFYKSFLKRYSLDYKFKQFEIYVIN